MKTFFVSLCTLVLIVGILRGFVSEETFSRYFALTSGVMILLMITLKLPDFHSDSYMLEHNITIEENNQFESMVLTHSEQSLSEWARTLIYDEFEIACTVYVDLCQYSESIEIESIRVEGMKYDNRVENLLVDKFSAEEGDIYFN